MVIFEGFEYHAMPCEGCGELVRIGSSDVTATASYWADDSVVILCAVCWAVRFPE